jgi:hypothetical protein
MTLPRRIDWSAAKVRGSVCCLFRRCLDWSFRAALRTASGFLRGPSLQRDGSVQSESLKLFTSVLLPL